MYFINPPLLYSYFLLAHLVMQKFKSMKSFNFSMSLFDLFISTTNYICLNINYKQLAIFRCYSQIRTVLVFKIIIANVSKIMTCMLNIIILLIIKLLKLFL